MSIEIATLPEEHISKTLQLAPEGYTTFLARSAPHYRTTAREFHSIILHALYRVHLRALKTLKIESGTVALPVIAPLGQVVATASTYKARELPKTTPDVRNLLNALDEERRIRRGSKRIGSAFFHTINAGKPLIVIDEVAVAKAIEDALIGKKPEDLLKRIARETFLGFAMPHRIASTFSWANHRTVKAQALFENTTGVQHFEETFPLLVGENWKEDFAPLLKLLKKRKNQTS